MNRKFVDAFNQLTERSRYLPGLENWVGFRRGYVPIRHQARMKGKSSYSFRMRFAMAFDAAISFSDLPLKVGTVIGAIIALLGFLAVGTLVIRKLFFVSFLPGYSSTISVIVLLGGLQILITGLASIYIGRIFREVQNRPLYIINERINFQDS